jgi:hypothetical protein
MHARIAQDDKILDSMARGCLVLYLFSDGARFFLHAYPALTRWAQ